MKALLEDSDAFLSEFVAPTRFCWLEPYKGRFDLSARSASGIESVFEIKVWHQLKPHQMSAQSASAKEHKLQLYYLLLGRTATRWTKQRIESETAHVGKKISYNEIIGSLQNVPGPLAEAYKQTLAAQRGRILSIGDPDC